MRTTSPLGNSIPGSDPVLTGVVNQRLRVEGVLQLSGILAGIPFVKVVVDKHGGSRPIVHFINHARYQFHSDYIAEQILRTSAAEVDANIDEFNKSVYLDLERRFYLGLISFHKKSERFFTLETVEIDTMDQEMIRFFYNTVKNHLDMDVAVLFKPANHHQEKMLASMEGGAVPFVFSRDLYAERDFVPLNPGNAKGRIRVFKSEQEFRQARGTLEWSDIIVMDRVPDDIPRLSGIINAQQTTPLSHTNVLASGWQIPNAIQIGIVERIEKEQLDNQWVSYSVDPNGLQIQLEKIESPVSQLAKPAWTLQRVKLEEPETRDTPILELDELRMSDRYRYGTKAANLGELRHLLEDGSERILGFYKIKRPPRANLLPHLARLLGLNDTSDPLVIYRSVCDYLNKTIEIPRGIAIPFSVQQEFLESSPRIQQAIGKLKMALELNSRAADSICVELQNLIRHTRLPEKIRDRIDARVAHSLAGVSSFVIRSSSNAEDLEGFSAAGIYESINHVTTAENIFQSIKEVWASLVSPRSVRLRKEVGISIDQSYMGVIIQEEIKSALGGVLVTNNPTNRADFRNVYVNVSRHSVQAVVQGGDLPIQYLYNVVEGGGRTLSLGNAQEDLNDEQKSQLQKLALVGRLLQSHYSPNYTFDVPLDIEWVVSNDSIYILQLRPYAT